MVVCITVEIILAFLHFCMYFRPTLTTHHSLVCSNITKKLNCIVNMYRIRILILQKEAFVTYVCKSVCYSCYPVPSPSVDVGFATPGAVTYAGNNVTLICAITLLGGVTDSDVTVSSRWTKDGAPFSGISGRVTLTPSQRLTGTSYFTQLMFSPLSSSMDNGTYMCNVTLTPRQPQFVTGTSISDSIGFAIRGEIYVNMKCDLADLQCMNIMPHMYCRWAMLWACNACL